MIWLSLATLGEPFLLGVAGSVLAGLIGLIAVIMLLFVVLPAVWSRKRTRREAALAVLDRIMKR
jgi:uncharacterized protein (DUF2062 family)